jgi:serine/threonine-protein kinase
MSLTAGTPLGPYEIIAPIGQGGMGEVYKATDTRLGRAVAIKVLPRELASDPKFRERFDREARVISQLDHPHICALYDVGAHEGTAYLVMPYLEGETLAQRLAKGPLRLSQTLPIAVQIAAALAAAHRRGVVHRDLKPGNVMLTREGAKLLDFGLARTRPTGAASDVTMSEAPTVSGPLTQAGSLLGTLQYMAPEQAEGLEADARSDVFAFGAVLYEMLTDRKAFEGGSHASLRSAIVTADPPPVETLRPAIPPALARLVTKCLAKSPDARWQSASDLADELAWIGSSQPEPFAAPAGRIHRPAAAWAVAALSAAAWAFAALGWWRAARPVERVAAPLVRLDVDLGSNESLALQDGANIIVSPDGTRLVYVSRNHLVTRRLDQAQAVDLPATEGAKSPFFSPDGQWVGFFADGKLKRISVEGGPAIALSDAPSATGGAWGADGMIVARLRNRGLERVAATGGTPVRATELSATELLHSWPQILPGGDSVLFTSNGRVGGWDRATIEVVSLKDGSRTPVVREGTFGRYLASGHLTYVNGGTLFAVPFDVRTLRVVGTPVPVVEEVAYSTTDGSAQVDASATGLLVYRRGSASSVVTVQWLDGAGRGQFLLAKPGVYVAPRLSPDGRRVAVGFGGDAWVYQWEPDAFTRLTFEGGSNYSAWTPDGQHLVLRSRSGLAWTRATGAGRVQELTQGVEQWPWSFTPDGRRLAFQERNRETGWDLLTTPIERVGEDLRAGKPEVFLQTPFDEQNPAFSPDGRWLAYSSNESGPYQVYVRAFPDTGGKWQVSNDGGRQPEWSKTSRELFFRSADNQIVVVPYSATGESFVAARPRVWSEQRLAALDLSGMFDLAPDGRRIAALMPAGAQNGGSLHSVVFLQNVFDALRRLAPRAE